MGVVSQKVEVAQIARTLATTSTYSSSGGSGGTAESCTGSSSGTGTGTGTTTGTSTSTTALLRGKVEQVDNLLLRGLGRDVGSLGGGGGLSRGGRSRLLAGSLGNALVEKY